MNLSQEDWKTQLESDANAVIIDVRTEEECSEGIIPNAIINDTLINTNFGQVFR